MTASNKAFGTVISLGVVVAALLLLAGCGGAKEKPSASLAAATGVAGTPSPVATPIDPLNPRATATIGPSPDTARPQLAIAGEDLHVSLVDHDGSGKQKLLDGEQCPKVAKLLWSPSGNELTCLSENSVLVDANKMRVLARYNMVTVDMQGRVLKKAGPVDSFAWSPTGRHMAYSVLTSVSPTAAYTYYVVDAKGTVIGQFAGARGDLIYPNLFLGSQGDIIWSPDGSALAYLAESGEVTIYEIGTKAKRELGVEVNRALSWALDGKAMLVASKYDLGELLPRYEAGLLDLTTGQIRRVPELDNFRIFWLSPDSRSAVVYFWGPPRARIGSQVGILNLTTLAMAPIPDSIIRYPGEIIQPGQLAFSRDGSSIVWADTAEGVDIYQAGTNAAEVSKLASFPFVGRISFAPDLTKMAYVTPSSLSSLRVSNLDGSGAVEIGSGRFPFAWRSW